jgi:energy-coupling factor transporter ATP-binding protein EcfA2
MQKLKTTDVFTPTKPARLAFVERQALNDQLVDALRTPGKQVVVYGPSGSGKTTLLVNKLEQLYPAHITSRCTAATTFESLLLGAFDQLNVYYSSGASTTRKQSITFNLGQDYLAVKSAIEAASSIERTQSVSRILPPQLTPQRLAEFCGAAGCCWLLEDFHKVRSSEKAKLSQVMKVFMDTAADYSEVKIVAIGAEDSAREVIQYDPEMRNRVAEIAVPTMSQPELVEVLSKGESLLNLRFGDLKSEIASYSSGLAAVCHQLSLYICFAADINYTCDHTAIIDGDQLRSALERYVQDASDSLKAAFDLATRQQRVRRFDNTRLILKALANLGTKGGLHAEILKAIRQEESDYPAGNLTTYLKELRSPERGSILRFDPLSGKYFFNDPLYLAYSQCHLNPPNKSHRGSGIMFNIHFSSLLSDTIYNDTLNKDNWLKLSNLMLVEPKEHQKGNKTK